MGESQLELVVSSLPAGELTGWMKRTRAETLRLRRGCV